MLQIVRQTWQERYDMYMTMPKEELAKMLAESAKYTNPDGCAEFATSNEEQGCSTISDTSGFTDDCFIFWR